MNSKSIYIFFTLLFSIFNSYALNIQAYCSDMRHANNYSEEWEKRCIGTLEVQKKYDQIADDEANQQARYENIRSKTKLGIEVAKIDSSLDRSNPDTAKVLSIMLKMKQACELTTPSKRSEDPFCQSKNFQEYEDMLKMAERKK